MAYSIAQLKMIAKNAGFPSDMLDIMAAIAIGESSGDPNARNPKTGAANPKTGELSIGLWQINIAPKLKRPYTEAQLKDPNFNAKVALKIYNSEGLKAWGAYTNGSYKKYLDKSAPDASGTDTTPPDGANDSNDTLIIAACIIGLVFFLRE